MIIPKSLTQPGRSECGVQLARGFPPKSKWTYGEVFHPAVVPQPPFNLNCDFFNSILSKKYFMMNAYFFQISSAVIYSVSYD